MRKLKLQVQMSVDGYIAGPHGEMDWMLWDWDDKLKNYVAGITEPVDTIILGRKLAEGFIPHWASAAAGPDNPELVFAKKMNDSAKVVFTKTLRESMWSGTTLAKGDLTQEVNTLKKMAGKDIIVYCGSTFVSGLIAAHLIDEFHLFVNPSVLGNGMPIFKDLKDRQNLTLVKSERFDCGIVVLFYKMAQ